MARKNANSPAAADVPPGYEFNSNETFREIIYDESWKEHRPQEYHTYRRLWDTVPRNKSELDFPIHLDIETTNICNLKCPMCPRTFLVEQRDPNYTDAGTLSREEFTSIIDQGVAGGVKSIKLNYLSEPLAHKDVVWQVEYAKKQGIVDVLMNSNATLLKPDMSAKLLEAGLDGLFISFDAINPKMFAERRLGTSLGKVIDNLYTFIQLRNEKYPHVHVRVSMVMYDDSNWHEQFQGLQIMWKGLVDAVGYGFYTERDPDARGEYPEVPGFWCAQPFQRMFLKHNGNVTICCVDDKDEIVLGNWRKQPLAEIWRSEGYRSIRQTHRDGEYHKMALCRKCFFPHAT